MFSFRNLWSYVSPRTRDKTHLPTPKSEPVFKKPAIPNRRASMHELTNEPSETWSARSPSSIASSSVVVQPKRKRGSTTSPTGRKKQRMESEDEDVGNDFDTAMNDESVAWDYEDEGNEFEEVDDDEYGDMRPAERHRRRTTSSLFPEEEGDTSLNTTLVVDDEFAERPSRRIVSLPEEHRMPHVSDVELRKLGWDDEYITVIQRVAMRGHEPLLPHYLKFCFSWLPSELFTKDEDAFISSVKGNNAKAGKALEPFLFQLGGKVRDCVEPEYPGRFTPEHQMRKEISAFNKWAQKDAELDQRTAIPLLALVFQSDGSSLVQKATEKCRRLAARYREALQVQHSVEASPEGSVRSLLSYPLPTIYAIVGSDTKFGIMAYDPKKGRDTECSSFLLSGFDEVEYDVWNSLALAIVICHARNVQMQIAEDTGIGSKADFSDAEVEMVVDDPDA